MPSLRQLEFAFRTVAASLWDASRFAQRSGYKASDLETKARQLLCSLGAKRIATELRVEWNSRLKTAAGRADYRQKLISLNPRLAEHPSEVDRTLRHELAHILAQFRQKGRRRISPHGPEWQQACRDLGIADEKRCHTLPFPARRYAPRFIYRCPNCRRDFPRVRKIKRTVACLACCRAHNGGEFDVRFRLRLVGNSGHSERSRGIALVLCVDEKSQIQALERTQPGLPLKPGRCGTFTHDYQRHGTTTLFAALNVLEGKVIGDCMLRHRHQEFIRFLKIIDAQTEARLPLHLIIDNYGTHKHPRVKAWARRHPRFHLHFTPTASSWLNLVECWFAQLTQKRIRRGSFHNLPALIKAISDYIEATNQNPRVFVWTAPLEHIMNKIDKCKEALDALPELLAQGGIAGSLDFARDDK